MEITIRKANGLQHAILDALKSVKDVAVEIELNEFQDGESEILDADDRWHAAYDDYTALLASLYEIRDNVSTFNAVNGVSARLGRIASIERELEFLRKAEAAGTRLDKKSLNGLQLKLASENNRFGRETVTTAIFGGEVQDEIKANISRLKKEKQNVKDELIEINVGNKIALSDATVNTLSLFEIV